MKSTKSDHRIGIELVIRDRLIKIIEAITWIIIANSMNINCPELTTYFYRIALTWLQIERERERERERAIS
jgi:hypothetical protein